MLEYLSNDGIWYYVLKGPVCTCIDNMLCSYCGTGMQKYALKFTSLSPLLVHLSSVPCAKLIEWLCLLDDILRASAIEVYRIIYQANHNCTWYNCYVQ